MNRKVEQIVPFAIDGEVYVALLEATEIDEKHDVSVIDSLEKLELPQE